MWAYIVRRILLTIPIVLGVVCITTVLFSTVAKDPARAYAGKNPTHAAIEQQRAKMGLDKPTWFKWSIPLESISHEGDVVTITTPWAHGLDQGDSVSISGIQPAGYNGAYRVESVQGPKSLSFRFTDTPAGLFEVKGTPRPAATTRSATVPATQASVTLPATRAAATAPTTVATTAPAAAPAAGEPTVVTKVVKAASAAEASMKALAEGLETVTDVSPQPRIEFQVEGTIEQEDKRVSKEQTYVAPSATAAEALAKKDRVSPETITSIGNIHNRNILQRLGSGFDSQFFDVLLFRFPNSMRYDEPLWDIVKRKAPASMAIQIPAFIIVLGIQLSLALFTAVKRGRWQDYTITVTAVLLMSVPGLSVYLFAQWALGKELALFPVAGWEDGLLMLKFAALPIFISVLLGIGGGTRFYRTVVLDEIYSDYVRTARAKGVPQREVLFTHVLKNVMIPVITNTVTALPGLITGALLLESIFQIPGLGNLMVEALNNNDRPVIMAMTYVLSIVYCVLILVSDILYTVVNPQVSLK